jgi:hypothetical protein
MLLMAMVALFVALAVTILDGNWRAGLMVTLMIGFLQDPLRKLTPGQPSQLAGLVLIAFVLCGLVLYERRQGFQMRNMFWTMPQLVDMVPAYFTLIGLQALNSLGRFGDPVLTTIGAAFYLAPALGLWMGFQVGLNPLLLRRLMMIYMIGSAICGISVYLSFRGVDNPLLKEVGEGILITFRYGFSAQGASGLWRTSEIASWHLGAASSIAATLAVSSRKPPQQLLLLLLSVAFAFLCILTGRRKAIVLVVAFAVIFALLLLRRTNPRIREQIISSLASTSGIAYVLFGLVVVGALGRNFGEYISRASSTWEEILPRFQLQGIGAIIKAFDLAQFIGLGVGSAAQTGNLQVTQRGIENLGYVSEGGGGRLIVELGVPGIILVGIMGFFLVKLLLRNFKLVKYLPTEVSILLLGLVSFAIANVPLFISAAQLYGDPFVLILMSLSLGSFLAVPSLVAQAQQQAQAAAAARALAGSSAPLSLR